METGAEPHITCGQQFPACCLKPRVYLKLSFSSPFIAPVNMPTNPICYSSKDFKAFPDKTLEHISTQFPLFCTALRESQRTHCQGKVVTQIPPPPELPVLVMALSTLLWVSKANFQQVQTRDLPLLKETKDWEYSS